MEVLKEGGADEGRQADSCMHAYLRVCTHTHMPPRICTSMYAPYLSTFLPPVIVGEGGDEMAPRVRQTHAGRSGAQRDCHQGTYVHLLIAYVHAVISLEVST